MMTSACRLSIVVLYGLSGMAAVARAADLPAPALSDVPLAAPAGISQAVVVQGYPLVHTRQLFPLDRQGELVGPDSVDQQIDQLLENLAAVLKASGSDLNRLVRINVYAIEPATVDQLRTKLAKRLEPSRRPALTAVLTPMPFRGALVAADAVAAVGEPRAQPDATITVPRIRCDAVAGLDAHADAAVLPPGGIVYLSGYPAEGGLTESAVTRSINGLWNILEQLKLSPAHVVQIKIFLRPAVAAEDVRREIKEFFPEQMAPPMIFVEWIAQAPVEIEVVARLPPEEPSADRGPLEFYTPPEVRPLSSFSRVAMVRGERLVFTSGLFSQKAGRGEDQARDVFGQLEKIVEATGSDMRHLAKATYFVVDEDAGRGIDRVRPQYFQPERPPAASKVMVYGVGHTGRTLTLDVIAVGH